MSGKLIVDVHEPSWIRGIADEVAELPVDALVIGDERKYVIERKTVTDFVNSVRDGRLFRQLAEMARLRDDEQYVPLLVVTGNWKKAMKMLKVTYPQFYGMQVGVSSFGATLIHLPSKDMLVGFYKYLVAKSGQKPSHGRPTIPKPLERTIEEERLDVLCAVRGIGYKTAQALLATGKPLKEIVSMTKEELEPIIGRKAEHFYEVFNGVSVAV